MNAALTDDERQALRRADRVQQALDWQQRRKFSKLVTTRRFVQPAEHAKLVARMERTRICPEREPRRDV